MPRRPGRWLFLVLGALLVTAAMAMRLIESPPRRGGGSAAAVAVCEIQGTGLRSPFAPPEGNRPGRRVTTSGVVAAVLEPGRHDGFWLQDPAPPEDCPEPSSKAVFVHVDSGHPRHERFDLPQVGDRVEVRGPVSEFYGSTQVRVDRPDLGNRLRVLSRGHPLPGPVPIDAERAGRGHYSALEHMRVELRFGQTYLGTTKFGETFLVPRPMETRIRRGDPRTDLLALRGGLRGGGPVPAYAFDLVEGAVGPLGWAFGNAQLFVEDPAKVRTVRTRHRPEPIAPPPAGAVAIATFNLFDYWPLPPDAGPEAAAPAGAVPRATLDVRRRKLARAIAGPLHAPAVVAVQEVGGRSLLAALAVELNDLLAEGSGRPSAYEAVLVAGESAHRSHVGFLVDSSRATYSNPRLVDPSAASPNAGEPGGCRAGPDRDRLHHRPPLAVELQVGEQETWTAVAVHFKSMHGGSEENLYFEPCRAAQAESVRRHLEGVEAAIVLGDLNAFEDSPTLAVFTADDRFTNLVDRIPADRRHSFAYRGRVQFLDHILVSAELAARVSAVDSPKIVTDVPAPLHSDDPTGALAASDHDPVVTYLQWRRPGRRPAGAP